ncbi:MAG TPA: hypothetical protein VN761_12720, partial [Candidatus Polarisedimenticolia bacterium]|nr:hypothetical protein [Candidatus Polarisedimenticolia bacterium]
TLGFGPESLWDSRAFGAWSVAISDPAANCRAIPDGFFGTKRHLCRRSKIEMGANETCGTPWVECSMFPRIDV